LRKLTILCDLDSTLSRFNEKWCRAINEHFGKSFTPDDFTDWEVAKCLGLPEKECAALFDAPGFCRDIEPVPGAIEALARLHDEGHDIHIVTSSTANMIPDKLAWIGRHLPWLPKRNVWFGHRKEMLFGDVFIDDGGHNVEAYRAAWGESPVILMPAYPYNLGADDWDVRFPPDAEHWGQVGKWIVDLTAAQPEAA
jgi:5'-nucleotidase